MKTNTCPASPDFHERLTKSRRGRQLGKSSETLTIPRREYESSGHSGKEDRKTAGTWTSVTSYDISEVKYKKSPRRSVASSRISTFLVHTLGRGQGSGGASRMQDRRLGASRGV